MINKLTHFALPWDMDDVVNLEFNVIRNRHSKDNECMFTFTNKSSVKFHVQSFYSLKDLYTVYYATIRELGWNDE